MIFATIPISAYSKLKQDVTQLPTAMDFFTIVVVDGAPNVHTLPTLKIKKFQTEYFTIQRLLIVLITGIKIMNLAEKHENDLKKKIVSFNKR